MLDQRQLRQLRKHPLSDNCVPALQHGRDIPRVRLILAPTTLSLNLPFDVIAATIWYYRVVPSGPILMYISAPISFLLDRAVWSSILP